MAQACATSEEVERGDFRDWATSADRGATADWVATPVEVCVSNDNNAGGRYFTERDGEIVGSKSDDRYTSQLLDIKEGMLADGLRASLMEYTIVHIIEFNGLLGQNPIDVLNADVPESNRFGKHGERHGQCWRARNCVNSSQRTIAIVEE